MKPLKPILLIFLAALLWAEQPGAINVLPKALQGVGLDQHLGAELPLHAPFRDEEGRQISLGAYFRERPVVLALVYYRCPMLCTEILNGVVRSLRALSLTAGRDFDVISISIDPSESSDLALAKKRQYVGRYGRQGSENGWHFLTGTKESIEAVASAVGFRYTYNPETKLFAHASGIVLATPEGRLSRYFYGVEYEPRDLRLGLVESSRNRIGSRVDQFLLFCFHYDPAAGKYTAAVQNLMRIGAALTLIVLGWFLSLAWRRDSHANQPSPRGAH